MEVGMGILESDDQEVHKLLAAVRIPPRPAYLIEVMEEAMRPDARINLIADKMQLDAGLSASLLKLANSPLYARAGKITSIHQAINLLGLKATLYLLNHVALLQGMAGKPPNFEKFWERSALMASVCAMLTNRVAEFSTEPISEDDAYITGLFHDCGIPVLMLHFPNYRAVMIAQGNMGQAVQTVENAHFSTDHAVVGSMMARTWFLPEGVCNAIRHHHDTTLFTFPRTRGSRESTALAGMLHMAQLMVNTHFCQPYADWDAVGVFVLHFFEISKKDFAELKDDMLGWLADHYEAAR
jgi:HD-like signal output (HDOD) protein